MKNKALGNNKSSAGDNGGWAKGVPDKAWAPLSTASLVLLAGVVGLIVGQPLLFPSLGPTAFLQAENPDQPSARFYNVVAGHIIGLVAGVVAILVFNASNAPSVLSSGELTSPRILAAGLAIALTMLGSLLAKASHPPAAATTLLIALGAIKITGENMLVVVGGVLIVALAGEVLRRGRV